ncbi:MAG: 4Fe-4S dicluster domain-containing protein [Anaerolineae bacterium]|nr:4Fe-4S dicluster domain-containing protein [Anaerolineae bacterium]
MSHIVINEDRCKGCELCTTACPQGDLVQMADYFNVKGYRPSIFVDPENRCTGCTLCAMMCPDMVITVYRTPRKKRKT